MENTTYILKPNTIDFLTQHLINPADQSNVKLMEILNDWEKDFIKNIKDFKTINLNQQEVILKIKGKYFEAIQR